MASEDSIFFHRKGFRKDSFVALREMRENGELCDLVIGVRDCSFAAHRVVLAAGIPYFRSIFASNAAETVEKEITIADLEPSSLESLIEFAYNGKLKISSENVYSLLQASRFLKLEDIFEACVAFLAKRVDSYNFFQMLHLTETLDNSNLIESMNRYALKNFEEFSKSPDFSRLPLSWLKNIISQDKMIVSGEEKVLEAILDWVEAKPSERHPVLPELLKEIRMIHLPAEYLMFDVSSKKFIRNSIPCRDLIDEVKNYFLSSDKSVFPNLKMAPRKYINVKYDLYAVCRDDVLGVSLHQYIFVNYMWWKVSKSKASNDTICYFSHVDQNLYMFLEETIRAFNTKKYKWKLLEPTHEKIEGAAVASKENKIYFFGSGATDFRCKIRCFNTHHKKWLKEGKMKIGRSYSAAATLLESIYVTGGFRMFDVRVDTVEKYNPSTGHWTECAPMLFARTSHSCTSMNGKLYVCGGFTATGVTRTAECYDPITNQWTSLSPMRFARRNFSLFLCNDKIFAVGGKMSAWTDDDEIEIYDPESDYWRSDFSVPKGFQAAVSVSSPCKRNSSMMFY